MFSLTKFVSLNRKLCETLKNFEKRSEEIIDNEFPFGFLIAARKTGRSRKVARLALEKLPN